MEESVSQNGLLKTKDKLPPREYKISVFVVFVFVYMHLASFYGIYMCFTKAKWASIVFAYSTFFLSTIGSVVGAHKLWAHRSFKATLPLEIFLMFCQTMAFHFSVYYWVRDHRLHHKYSDTDADPHNASRGLFFSHMGWLMVKKHPDVIRLGAGVSMEDITGNPVLEFQRRNAKWLLPLIAFIIPTLIPYLWNEVLSVSWHLNQLRLLTNLHLTFLVNSVSHTYGVRPYDASIKPRQSLPIILLTFGEGYHNYHHAFPFDYKSADRGNRRLNLMAFFVEMCAKLGLAYDLKEASEEVVKRRMERDGDGTDLWGRNKCGESSCV